MPIVDENLKMVEEARARLLKEHGGYKGLREFLIRQDVARQKKMQKPRSTKSLTSQRRRKSSTHTP